MLTETHNELAHDRFVGYKECGGCFSKGDYDLVRSSLEQKESDNQSMKSPETFQVNVIADHCNIEITPDEMHAYSVMRKIMPTDGGNREYKNGNTTPVWKMSDQELLRQIVLATEGPEDKYQTITKKYPNIFD